MTADRDTSPPVFTAERVAAAMKARDFTALAALIAPDAQLRSPITTGVVFHGREQVVELLKLVRDSYEKVNYTDVFQQGELGVQIFTARIAGRDLQLVDVMRLDAHGSVREFTVFCRPLPGLAMFAAALAPRIARRHSRWRGLLATLLVRPLVIVTTIGDRIALWLVRAGLEDTQDRRA